MRRRHLTGGCLLLAGGLIACGSEETHVNRDRPAAAINVTAAILDGRLTVSPTEFGAGPVRLLVTNQTAREQAITFETTGQEAGTTTRSAPISPAGVTTLEVATEEGEYELRAADRAIEPVPISVGAPRPSAQAELLQP